MSKKNLVIRTLCTLVLATRLFAAGSVQQSVSQLPLGTGTSWAVVFNWVGDATTGTVPDTIAAIGPYGVLQGFYITAIETTPGTPAPTSGYGITITDIAGVDVLSAAAISLSATAPQAFSASTSLPPINGTFTVHWAGQHVAGARGKVYVYLTAPGNLIGSGSAGTAGAAGTPGTDGLTILNGSGVPSGGLGVNGDYYIDNSVTRLYGPKSAGAWGSGVTLIGPTGSTGAAGAAGTNGLSVLNGTGAPSGGTGVNGDFYIDTASSTIYGPKSAGSWGSGTSLIGPQGPPGSVITLGPLQFLQGKPNVSSPTQQSADLPYFLTSDFDFPAQAPGGTLTASVGASATLTPCPLGVAGADANHYYRIAAGTGTAETVVGTGGSCTSGASSGTLQFTPANNHSGAWTIASASNGAREAILYSAGNAIIRLPSSATLSISGTNGLVVDQANLTIVGGGWGSVIQARASENLNVLVNATSANGLQLLNFTVDGNRGNNGTNPTFGTGVHCGTDGTGGCNHVLMQGLQVYHAALFGILITDSNVDVEISRNWIHDNGGVTNSSGGGTGIYLYRVSPSSNVPVTGARIVDNYISENHNTVTTAGPGGAAAWAGIDIIFSGNYLLNNYNNGGQVIAVGQYGPAVIADNAITLTATGLTQGTSGIEIQALHQTITGNTIVGHEKGWGIAMEGDPAGLGTIGASDTTITGNYIYNVYMGIGLINAGGIVRGTTITGNRIASGTPAGGSGVGVGLDSAAAATTINANNFTDTPTPVQDNSIDGAFTYANYPMAANLVYGGAVASADAINMRCGQTATVTGSTTIRFLLLPSDTASTLGAGCSVTLIPAAGATWTLGSTGNISVAIGSVAVGRPITLVSNGTLFNPLASASLPAGTPLQYIRYNAQTSAAEAAAFPFLIAADYNFPAQAPGGSIAIGSNTVTLTPCPLGVGGSDVNHYVYLSSGTGTAEGVLLAGGSCTSGATSGTIVFTAAHTHTGAWTVSSAQGGIFEAYNTLPVTGGQVRAPCGQTSFKQSLILGRATSIAQSTINGVGILGCGSGRAVDISIPIAGATQFLWNGPAGGTVVKILGPIGNVELRDLMIDGNEGGADIGLDILHSYLSTYGNLNITGWNAVGLRSQAAAGTFPFMVAGNNSNRFDTVEVSAGYGGAANIACLFGQATVVGMTFDFASNTMINSVCLGGAGIGANIRFADNNSFLQTTFNGDIAALKFTSPGAGGFPANNVFIQSPLLNLLTSSAGFVAISPNFFYPLTTGEYPQDLEAIAPFAAGTDAYNIQFGHPKRHPLYYAVVTNPSAIANTVTETAFGRSYAIQAGAMNERGATTCIKAAGRLSTTGTPTLTFRFKLGALTVGRFPFTTFANSSSQPFSIYSCMTTAVIGAGGNFLMGDALGILGGVDARTSEITGGQALDFTVSKTLTLTVEWGTADAANTVTLDNMRLEIAYPNSIE